jgi:CRP/FNR family transcriptional regulator
LLSEPDVSRFGDLRRSASLFSQGDKADAIFFIEDGLIKHTRTNAFGGRLILSVYGPNDLVGEESLIGGDDGYLADAEALSPSIVYKIPRETFRRVNAEHPELGDAFLRHLLAIKQCFAYKVELMCLHDVEERILYYLENLSKLVKQDEEESGYPLPLTQLELADLVGATRETTSTTLNQLEKRGFVKLQRRLLTVFPRQPVLAKAAGL